MLLARICVCGSAYQAEFQPPGLPLRPPTNLFWTLFTTLVRVSSGFVGNLRVIFRLFRSLYLTIMVHFRESYLEVVQFCTRDASSGGPQIIDGYHSCKR